jgi:ADP-ribose pyrophosphatase YjhB (NUDIX family)
VISDSNPPAGGTPEDLALPAIPVSSGALIFDRSGRLLILKPTYKSGWTIPGGVMEADRETPWQACRREVREECGIELRHAVTHAWTSGVPGRAAPAASGSCSTAAPSRTAGWPRSLCRPRRSASTGWRRCPKLCSCYAARYDGGSGRHLEPGMGLPGRRAPGRGRQQAAREVGAAPNPATIQTVHQTGR